MTLQDPTITCPNCQTEIRLTESLAAPLVEATKRQYEDRIAAAETAAKAKADELKAERAKLDAEREAIDDKVREQLKAERTAIAASEAKKAREALSDEIDARSTELKELKDLLQAKDTKLAEAQKAQAELLRKERQLEDQKRELDLTVEKRVQESLTTAREQAKKEAEESLRLKVAEKEQTISSMQKQIEDLKRRAEQGSQQLQGEVQELELETLLASRFPLDRIEPVAKGEFGGDVIQRVAGPDGQPCASILWESKRTKNWSDGWLAKLRQDQRTAKADAAIIISQALPDGVDTFDLVDGVWVAAPGLAVPVAIAVRNAALEVSLARKAGEGQQTKTELVYQYLTGPSFRHRVEAIVEKFTDMKADLDRERKSMMRMWAKREAQITGVIDATAGMYGDLQGIAGRSLQEIDGLSMPLLGDNTSAQDGVTDAD